MRHLRLMLPLMSVVFALFAAVPANADDEVSFRDLFNGKNLDGWKARPHFDPRKLEAMSDEERNEKEAAWWADAKKHWRVENGELVNDGEGPYLTTKEDFGDIEFELEYKTVAAADSGIYLRATPQVQIWDSTKAGGKWNRGADKGSGGLFNNTSFRPGRDPLVHADRPFGEWNKFRIRQVGARTTVWLNDHLVVDDIPMENYYNRARPLFARGPIQLQTHGGEIRWRNIRIREIGTEEANALLGANGDGFESAFNGRDFTGWKGDTDNYEVVDGAITCKPGKGGNLFTSERYSHYVVRLEFKLPPKGNNGLAIHYPGEGGPHVAGLCELQVLDSEHPAYADLDPRQYHGSAYGMVAAHRGFLRETGEWNFQEVTVRGSKLKVELNGYVILDADLSKVTEFKDGKAHPGLSRREGHFGFAGHSDPVAFRNIRIKRLPADDVLADTAWPQFRGRNASGLGLDADKPPTKIGPEEAHAWKIELPPGHSSPAIYGNDIYVTAVDDDRLLTMRLDRVTGEVIWQAEAKHGGLESVHQIGSHAQSSPATDGSRVISFFGSCGMFCYNRNGDLLWHKPMGPFNNEFGAGSSPIIVDDRIILSQDHDTDSFLMAIDKESGETIWKTDRSEFPRNYCTPVVWTVDGRKQIVIAATLRVVGYDLESGEEIWTVRGISRCVCTTPAIGANNTLYLAGWARGGDETERIRVEPFEKVLEQRDANSNKTIEEDELEEGGPIRRRFPQVDRDKSGSITREEFEYYRNLFDEARNVVMAIRPGGKGDVTKTHVNWEFRKYVPFCASPVVYNDYVFAVKDGGILTSLDAKTGRALKTARLPGTGNYYCSPVAAAGHVYFADQKGEVSVVTAWAEWKTVHEAKFEDPIYATPAIVGSNIFVRTNKHLYCFGPTPE